MQSPSILGKVLGALWKTPLGALGGGAVGMPVGMGLGSALDTIRGVEGKPLTPQEQRMWAIREALADYDVPGDNIMNWEAPKGLTMEQWRKHKKMQELEKEHWDTTGTPY